MTQASDSMNNMYEKSEQHQNNLTVNASLHNQKYSIFDVSRDPIVKCEPQQWNIKSDLYLQVKQDLTPCTCLKSELSVSTLNLLSHDQHYPDDTTIVSTQHQEYQSDIVMTSPKKYNGL